jgi:hypothetical protein
MPIQVRGVLVHAMSGTELSRVRTEFRLRLPEPSNKSPLESRGPTLLCNHVRLVKNMTGYTNFLARSLRAWVCFDRCSCRSSRASRRVTYAS